ncbi:MAG TPA: hypothetical protein VMV73_02240, partial [Candidatus Dormibacteraeota bacterium]|nr:hypothetical protein [Candidatus Dormibacteraeota bacterium]
KPNERNEREHDDIAERERERCGDRTGDMLPDRVTAVDVAPFDPRGTGMDGCNDARRAQKSEAGAEGKARL